MKGFWTNLISLGSPYLQYYGFLYFYLVGLFDLIVGDFFTTIKISLVLSHIASILGMYMLTRVAGRSRAAGVLGALAYGLCFWHLQQVLIMGRFPLSLFYAVLPWPFYFFERLRLPARRVAAVCGASHVRLFCGFTPLSSMDEDRWGRMLSAFESADELCGSLGMEIAIETHGAITELPDGSAAHAETVTTDPAALARLVRELPPRVGFNYDAGNLRQRGLRTRATAWTRSQIASTTAT